MPTIPSLEADCSKCAALCCVVFAFDKSDEFAIDKEAGETCVNLETVGSNCGKCKIHTTLKQDGFGGCAAYDCHGAGQRLMQEIYKGKSWIDDPALLPDIMDSFRGMLIVHELILLLQTASRLPLTALETEKYNKYMDRLCPENGWTERSLLKLETSEFRLEVGEFLVSLRHHANEIQRLMRKN
ncbi:hypothetical protein [Hirschia baltica]|uniref:Pentapeptide repeat protein n=1 Tax=Hirschia baltica (strain ATCC 49814 / DSM 5838 / IFAM 1418) TaxID=582402 RepID=C6XMW6_HIRBI|nr:hypothetical protein [Hirschia baltica]ACT58136.1 hypothetical protein Hbal_0434 [Hirschia baltica ATCC 49814]